MTKHSEKGLHTVTPGLTVKDAKGAIEFYKKAFGAVEGEVCFGPDGKQVMHAELKIGDSVIMLNDEFPEMGCVGPATLGGTTVSLYLNVDDVDTWFDRAVKAGATVLMPVADQFWGDRFGQVADPYGHKWGISTHVKDLSDEEMKKGMEEWNKKQLAHAK
jgi:PhnB protein